jgi:hypothetical protein
MRLAIPIFRRPTLMKFSFKKIIFIIICAELLIWYWAALEVEQTKSEIVYKNKDGTEKNPPQLPKPDGQPYEKAS